jgi:hypothetical protein
MCTWAPTPRVAASFRAAFPPALEAEGGSVLIGSLSPIPFAPYEWAARAQDAEAALGPQRARALRRAVVRLRPAGPPPDVAPNLDLFPRDEFGCR